MAQGAPTIYSDGFRSLDPFTSCLVHPGDVRCDEDARRSRGEDDSEISDRAGWYQERGRATKKILCDRSNLWQLKLVGATAEAPLRSLQRDVFA
jgi:hypothetical protein